MINVDGDYEEIIEHLDNNPVYGIGFTSLHGYNSDPVRGGVYLNVGLFSLNEDHNDGDCIVCDDQGSARFVCNFSETKIELGVDEYVDPWDIEQPELTHLIRF